MRREGQLVKYLALAALLVAGSCGAADGQVRVIDGDTLEVGGVKLGLQFFTAQGPTGVRRVVESRLPVFLDLKLCDIPIPNTVAASVRAAAAAAMCQPFMLTAHVLGGAAMM